MKTLLITFVLFGFAFPWSASAQGSQVDICAAIENATAISPAVRKILERADKGMENAVKAPKTPSEEFTKMLGLSSYLQDWARIVLGTIGILVQNKDRVLLRLPSLSETTICQRFDELLIECKIDEAWAETFSIFSDDPSIPAIDILLDLFAFLNERLSHLRMGARDPRYEDAPWRQVHGFDLPDSSPQKFCSDKPDMSCKTDAECEVEKAGSCFFAPLCPFHSDYLPPSLSGYGCDSETIYQHVLPALQSFLWVENEYASLRSIEEFLKKQQEEPTERKHKTYAGCFRFQKVCSENEGISCNTDANCEEQNAGTCEEREPPLPVDDMDPDNLTEHAVFQTLRSPFSLGRDELRILEAFRALREEQGAARKPAEAFEERKQRSFVDFGQTLRQTGRALFRSWNRIKGGEETSLYTIGSNPSEEIEEALRPLHEPIRRLSTLVTEKDGVLRKFVRRFAYFLRRSCLFRPCNKRLEVIMAITLQNDCFPYANGKFLGDTKDDPRICKCMKAVDKEHPQLDFEMPSGIQCQ